MIQQDNQGKPEGATEHKPAEAPRHTATGGNDFNASIINRRRPLGSIEAEVLNILTQTGNDIIKKNSSGADSGKWMIIPIDAAAYRLHYSLAVMCGQFDFGGKKVIVTGTMILAGSNKMPTAESINYGGQPVEVIRTPGDAWDARTLQDVQEAVSRQYGAGIEIINSGAVVIPDTADVGDTGTVLRFLSAIQSNAYAVLESDAEFAEFFPEPIDVSTIDPQKNRMVATVNYNGPDYIDAIGQPNRSDISLALQLAERGRYQATQLSGFQHQAQLALLAAHGYVELVFSPPPAPQPGQMPDERHYYPRFVMTGVESLGAPITPEMYLLAIASARLISTDCAWFPVFKNYGDPMHDIGSIGYRIKQNPQDPNEVGKRIETSSNAFGDNELMGLIRRYIHPEVAFSIDDSDVGLESWLTSIFRQAAKGNREAAEYVIQSADNLTGGRFRRLFDGSAPVVMNDNNRVHLGTFTDKDGRTRDLREIDYLTILGQHGGKDLHAVQEWESTYNDGNAPIEMRLNTRMAYLREMSGNLRITGFAERLTFSQVFMSALTQAVTEAGLAIEADGLQTMYGQNIQVGNTAIAGQAVGGNVGFYSAGGGQSLTGPFVQRPMGRWMG